jgi:hypothetical protein
LLASGKTDIEHENRYKEEADMRIIMIAVMLVLWLAAPSLADNGFKEGAREIGQGFKEGSQKVGEGFKELGKEVKEGGKEVAQGFKKAGREVEKDAKKTGRTIGEWFRDTGKRPETLSENLAEISGSFSPETNGKNQQNISLPERHTEGENIWYIFRRWVIIEGSL